MELFSNPYYQMNLFGEVFVYGFFAFEKVLDVIASLDKSTEIQSSGA
jgi:hypothetical protein